MIAAQHEDCDVSIIALLSHGCDPNIQDYNVSIVYICLSIILSRG